MAAGFVYILYALDDAEEVGEIADAVRSAGWAVCFGHLGEPGADDSTSNLERLNTASCVLAVWSANAANSSVLRSDVMEAAQQLKLVLVTLDDASPPGVSQARTQLQSWRDGADRGALASMIAEIEVYAGPRQRRRGGIVPYAIRRPRRPPWLPAVAGGLLLSFLAVAAVWMILGQKVLDPVVEHLVENSTDAGEVSRDISGQAAMARWAQIPPGDLPAIRAFINEYKGTWAADEAQQQIQRLEQFAWRGVLGLDDLAVQLTALAAFRADYPDGTYNSDAVLLERQRREALERIGTDLIFLGYLSGAEGEDLATMRLGVESFERSIGLPPSGRITENLAVSLGAAAASKAGPHAQ